MYLNFFSGMSCNRLGQYSCLRCKVTKYLSHIYIYNKVPPLCLHYQIIFFLMMFGWKGEILSLKNIFLIVYNEHNFMDVFFFFLCRLVSVKIMSEEKGSSTIKVNPYRAPSVAWRPRRPKKWASTVRPVPLSKIYLT